MKTFLVLILMLNSISSFAEIIHSQKVMWSLQDVPRHRFSCDDHEPYGYFNGGMSIQISDGTPRNLPQIALKSFHEFKRCIQFNPDGLENGTLAGILYVDVYKWCHGEKMHKRTTRGYDLVMKENGLKFEGSQIISDEFLPNDGTCH
ncbi:MAG: hypothetical protein QE271_04845 [Bacteriovoracaceae bacterium]|nr:hypothetical protein [Bacteriovoracaceae bacterium]